MKCPLLLPLLLLGTVAALHLENDDPHLDIRETQADLTQDVEGSGEQEGELALTAEVIQSEGEEAKASTNQDTFEDEQAMELDPAAPAEQLQCPREEETIQLRGHPGCKNVNYLLVPSPMDFTQAQNYCERCYQGHLVSIHSSSLNHCLQYKIKDIHQGQAWIGGILKGWLWRRRFHWTDGSSWDYENWAPGEPGNGRGGCVALSSRDGHWRRAPCETRMPFICSS
ncbi:proteoglycan 3-like [Equus caballus]|uniref:C-type lectin domain-containing protein n=1 Tax=Equus caballus TaxID=9796 RepID=A0A3Q2IHS8_HORSE|nr:proteoglycan 3-like [Equus caballus]